MELSYPATLVSPYVCMYVQGVPKKSGISVQRSFLALKWPKIKKSKETDPP